METPNKIKCLHQLTEDERGQIDIFGERLPEFWYHDQEGGVQVGVSIHSNSLTPLAWSTQNKNGKRVLCVSTRNTICFFLSHGLLTVFPFWSNKHAVLAIPIFLRSMTTGRKNVQSTLNNCCLLPCHKLRIQVWAKAPIPSHYVLLLIYFACMLKIQRDKEINELL